MLKLVLLLWSCSILQKCQQVGAFRPYVEPFFFMCNYHGNTNELGVDSGEVAIRVSVAGNPEHYVPGQFYNVSVTSSLNFDGFLLTGLSSMSSDHISRMARLGYGGALIAQNHMCYIVHSHVSPYPSHQLSFVWLAPASGTGCISFLATATLGQQLLFKDTTVLRLCELGAEAEPERPDTIGIDSNTYILRDSFDTSSSVDRNIWAADAGAMISHRCGTVMHGDSLLFCDSNGDRQLLSNPLNTTAAVILQFAISAGTCGSPAIGEENITVSVGLNNCLDWTEIDSIRAPAGSDSEVHLVHIPSQARGTNVCFRWSQQRPLLHLPPDATVTTPLSGPKEVRGPYNSCWALDNVLIVNTADPPAMLADNFDPVDPSNWLFFPGANIQRKCRSDENAMYFTSKNQTVNYVVTRDVDLSTVDTADVILEESFETKQQPGWEIVGGRPDVLCGITHEGNAMTFDESGRRQACTGYINTKSVGNLRFYFSFGRGSCSAAVSDRVSVLVYVEDAHGHTTPLTTLYPKQHREPKLISLPVNGEGRKTQARFCWLQKYHGPGSGFDAWTIDTVQVFPHLPVNSRENKNKVVQFGLNMECSPEPEPNRLDLQFSTDLGQTWNSLHAPCLYGRCSGDHQPISSVFTADAQPNWKHVTLPVPYVAMVPHVRFRWNQANNGHVPNWAIDNVYIGHCKEGCNNHGVCSNDTCQCDFGYDGPTCNESVVPNPTTMMENFPDDNILKSSNTLMIKGASLNYNCGVLSRDKALVFDRDGLRQVVTKEFNTTHNRYLQFYIRVGSNSVTSYCAPPDRSAESVILDYTCNGGISWHLLNVYRAEDYSSPMSVMVPLPPGAKGTNCQFRWWQPEHDGYGRDVWALDGIGLNDHLFNTLNVMMNDGTNDTTPLVANLGKISDGYCDKRKSISFIDEHHDGAQRFLMTQSMHVGPSYVIQFDLVMGCRLMYSMDIDNRLYLEYSADHGLSWALVADPCLPPKACKEFNEGTIYEPSKYTKWTQITVPLPPATWGPVTKFRIRQSEWGVTDSWAVSRIYIGQQCPAMCSGHGQCIEGVCQCEAGFVGDDCHSDSAIESSMQADFGIRYEPDSDFLHIWGGEVTSGKKGCGTLLSGESMYFSDNGVRELQTKEFDTINADYIQFYIRIGGDLPDCNGAESRAEGVLLQYSIDGGTVWHTLQEMVPAEYRNPKFVHAVLPQEAKTSSTQFRWWQTSHSGGGKDQWAVDEIQIGRYKWLTSLEDNFNDHMDVLDSGMWSTVTEGVLGKYCQARDPTLILANQENDKFAITHDLDLEAGDVIQFRINVGCSNQFRLDHPVLLQYSHDGGQTWRLVQNPCYQEMDCQTHTEGSIYYSGPHGHWQTIVIPVSEEVAMHPVLFRWWQPGGYTSSFALNDVYIGPPCLDNCHRQGVCHNHTCVCEPGLSPPSCKTINPSPYGLLDWFDNHHEPRDIWRRVMGGKLGHGCGVVDYGNALYFSGDGTREAVTVPLNTTFLRMLQFVIRIGSDGRIPGCQQPHSRNEGVIVDYSTDNEITWHVLKIVEPRIYNGTTEALTLSLPNAAKTDRTIFRWWQPLGHGGLERAEWGLDSVIVGVNETNTDGFQDDFNAMTLDPHKWLLTESAIPRIACNSKGNALEFSRDKGLRFAETHDYHVTPSTFLQFDIAMGCDSLYGTYGTLYSVMLEYSVDMGQNWHPVVDECTPPNFECSGYHLSSEYMSEQHRNWTRVTVYLPPGSVSPATRFRWMQHSSTPRGNVWALDNVYLGEGCAWLCSGHGYCRNKTCVCDTGFTGEYCVPSEPLPMMLRDDFNARDVNSDTWREVYGGDNSEICGKIVSGKALTFHKDNLRMAVSRDIDTTMLDTVEFFFKFGCNGKEYHWPRSESVLLQYSSNGGITWNLLKEIHYHKHTGARFFSLDLPMNSRTNATRFRFWQPKNGGKMRSTWAVDNLFIGHMVMNPSLLMDDFDRQPLSDVWQFVNDGEVGSYCSHKTRQDTRNAGQSAMVFRRGPDSGEHYIVTRDMDVGPMSVLQFDINVGCESETTNKYPVKLEYSPNGGKTWHLLVPNCAEISSARCFDVNIPPSTFYAGTSHYWRRVVLPLDNLYTCGSLRFRWYQGFIPDNDFAPEWAIDNIFIGMACMDHCLGHGLCSDTMMCTCDTGFHGDSCHPSRALPHYLKDDFTQIDVIISRGNQIASAQPMNENKWWMWSGGQIDEECGNLISGASLHFDNAGERLLVSRNLDLSRVSTVQFFLRLGCSDASPDTTDFPVYLQFSTNGGVTWESIEQFDFNSHSNTPAYYALHLPEKARTNATQIRWWQPSLNGSFEEQWAIDQIYIGGDIDGVQPLQDDPGTPRETSWLLYPGAVVEHVCSSQAQVLHYNGVEDMRYAVSADVTVEEGTFIQFDITMGCEPSKKCFSIGIQYSHDQGNTWRLLQPPCLPSDVDCGRFYPGSTLVSDVHIGWNRVTIPMPHYTRGKAVRLRWIQNPGFGKDQSWALSFLYIGKNCPSMCEGHGRCFSLGCSCDSGWSGDDCSHPTTALPTSLYETFTNGTTSSKWLKVVGAVVTPACHVLASGNTLHFIEGCSRLLVSRDLDLRRATFIQFYFMFGCNAAPTSRNQGVLVDYSTDGGSTWNTVAELYYALHKSPRFVHLELPQGSKKDAVRIRWWQPKHGGRPLGDWAIDNIRIGGTDINPDTLASDFRDDIDPDDWLSADNMVSDDYCGASNVAKGTTLPTEDSAIISKDVNISDSHMLQFEINVGCGQKWNVSVPLVHLQYSSNYGLTWNYLSPQCLPNEPHCNGGPQMASLYDSEPMGMWRRLTFKLTGLPVSSGTRFRWTQKADGGEGDTHTWGIRNVYIGPSCSNHCSGRGRCSRGNCICDAEFSNLDCSYSFSLNPTLMKDNFEADEVDKTKWSLVQRGHVGKPCHGLVEDVAMVMAGPGNRQIVTKDLDLRNARFIQYHTVIGGDRDVNDEDHNGCFPPSSAEHSVVMQYSTDGGMSWTTLHILDFASYGKPKKDYILLPQAARTESTQIRWWQPVSDNGRQNGPQWAIDDVYIGGSEINPSAMQVSFDEESIQNDAPWEFNPYGQIENNICAVDGNSLSWEDGRGVRSFTTNQMIVQHNYMLQFKVVVGCDNDFDICTPHPVVKLLYNKNPAVDHWEYVQPLCLPDHNKLMECQPSHYHSASVYTPDLHQTWTWVTIELPETVYSSTTRFRWLQDASNITGPSWALDNIYIGEMCKDMCNGRGACGTFGTCVCHEGYQGKYCQRKRKKLIYKMFDSFEGGIFNFYWESIVGGGIGFGCGALLPYAHGKTLYFNDCGNRQATTVEMDLTRASKIMFVLQIGCREQTVTCNVKMGSGSAYRGVLLQYTKNRGAEWRLLARHDPEDYLNPKRAAYNLPEDAQDYGVQFRLWQPTHDGVGFDQWAIDQVEVIQSHNNLRSSPGRHP